MSTLTPLHRTGAPSKPQVIPPIARWGYHVVQTIWLVAMVVTAIGVGHTFGYIALWGSARASSRRSTSATGSSCFTTTRRAARSRSRKLPQARSPGRSTVWRGRPAEGLMGPCERPGDLGLGQ